MEDDFKPGFIYSKNQKTGMEVDFKSGFIYSKNQKTVEWKTTLSPKGLT